MPIPRQPFDPDHEGPLRGVRVLDFSRLVAGNMLSLQLADFGAEVVKVESPGRGDTLRDWREAGVSVYWKVYARNKKSIAVDLKSSEAPGIILDLAGHFDVLIESFRFRYLEKLGVGPDRLLERNPRLVVVRVSGFGQTGPYAKRPGVDPVNDEVFVTSLADCNFSRPLPQLFTPASRVLDGRTRNCLSSPGRDRAQKEGVES